VCRCAIKNAHSLTHSLSLTVSQKKTGEYIFYNNLNNKLQQCWLGRMLYICMFEAGAVFRETRPVAGYG